MVSAPRKTNVSAADVKLAAELFQEHGDFIYRIIFYKVKDPNLADDLYQDFFLSLAANPLALPPEKMRCYLYKAIINDVFDARRRMERYRKFVREYSESCKICVNKGDSVSAFSSRERVDALLGKAWDRLSPKESKVISLRFRENWSIKKIADTMKVKKSSVIRYTCIGLRKIREAIRRTGCSGQ